MATVRVEGVQEALRELAAIPGNVERRMKQTFFAIGGRLKAESRRRAPISPTTGMLKRFQKAGGVAGIKFRTKGTKKRASVEVELTKWYADRLDRFLSDDPRSTNRPVPGGLERSITFAADALRVEVFVPINSEAGKYAWKMHEEKGLSWFHRGPGTQAKGGQADDKFIERAIHANVGWMLEKIRAAADRAWRGR